MTVYGPLAEVAVGATAAIVVISSVLSYVNQPAIINAVVLVTIGAAMTLYSFLVKVSLLELPMFLWRIVFDSTNSRVILLLFWILNVVASIAFGIFVSSTGMSSTVHRKFFHLTVSLIYVSGLFFDRDFVWLSGWLMICIFVIIEVLRFLEVPPWAEHLNNFLLVFKDEQDSAILLTPIFLITGVFLPLFLSPNDKSPNLYHLAGVASVGVGDSMAAIIGSKFGKTKWPRRNKTVEGSVAMAVSIAVFLVLARPFCVFRASSYLVIAFVSLVLAGIEAFTDNIDNIILPIVGYLLL
ncbi:Phosphatidate cytidylyltransferase [Trichostrongylus colubriformis]|uniref:dolichol kinase n=1 Tax=Trichostrongylus colubriformis TaxID=6319 RepID=A0AAN8FLT7_TRICO